MHLDRSPLEAKHFSEKGFGPAHMARNILRIPWNVPQQRTKGKRLQISNDF